MELTIFHLIFACFSGTLAMTVGDIETTRIVGVEDTSGNPNDETTELGNWRKLWNEEWTNWIAMRNPYPRLPKQSPNVTEQQFLNLLHMDFKGNKTKCEDKDRENCPVWANVGYCDHERVRYSTWMAENCPESCQQCKDVEPVKEEVECKNLRHTCDRLSRFCSGPFKSHMTEWCPKSCRICNDSYELQEEGSGMEATVQSSAAINLKHHATTVRTAYQEEDLLCFPTKCGEVPAMEKHLSQHNYNSRFRRALYRETRKRRSSSIAFKVLNRRRRDNGLAPVLGLPPTVNLRIVGGSWAKKGEWPWHGLVLQKVGKYIRFCGITIICDRWLITAAHCLASREFGFPVTRDMIHTFTVYVGRHQGMFGYMESTTQVFSKTKLKRFIIHPQFKIMPSFSYDVALIELSTPIEFNRFVQPVCIPTSNTNTKNDLLWTYGWGATLGYGPSAQYLKKIALPYVTRDNCKKFVWGLPEKGILCAGGEERKDTCTGDSGGSLVKKVGDGRYYIFGVTSYGNKHCNSRYPYSPGIYTDVSQYYDWIRNQTNSCCDNRKKGIVFLKDSSM